MLEQAKFVGVRWISQKYDEAGLIIWSPQHSDFEGPMEISVYKPWGFSPLLWWSLHKEVATFC